MGRTRLSALGVSNVCVNGFLPARHVFLCLFARQLHTSGSRGICCVDVCKTRVVVFDVEEEVEEEDGEDGSDGSD